jgi:isoquinoline 1-oxidoreductase beta subunit
LSTAAQIDRRSFLAASGAIVIGLSYLAPRAFAQSATGKALNAWVRVGADDRVTILLSQSEIGQGIATTLPAILADELGADWSRIEVENSAVAPAYQNPRLHWMFTGNSESIASFAGLMRQAGAAAREMLIAAAVQRWGNVAAADCTTRDGKVLHRPTGRAFSFGALAEAAAQLPVPDKPQLRPAAELRLIGQPLRRRDIPAKVDGSAVFGIDLKIPGMVHAAVRQSPILGGVVDKFDAASIAGRPGVIGAYPIPNGIAVVAQHFWQAKTAADALAVSFKAGDKGTFDSASLDAQHRAALDGGNWGEIVNRGDAAKEIAVASQPFVREYVSAFQAHATMEPMNCVASVTPDGCDIWAPTQGQELTKVVAAAITNLPPEKVRVHWTYSGGGFGRRLLADFIAQAVILSMQVQKPVKVIWTREEDMTHDFYRPATLTRLAAALGRDGRPSAIAARLVSATQLQPVSPAPLPPNTDPRVTEGLEDSHYQIAHFRLDYHRPELPAPTSVLRTTGFGPNIFALESFIDELAHAAKQDPYQFRRAMLSHHPRALKVLDLAAEKSNWRERPPKGRGRGLAFYEAFDTFMAQVVELEVGADKAIRLHKIVTVADPGTVFDPGIATSNLEGGVVWGLTCAMKSEITFAGGAVEQTNFDGYDMVHLWETAPVVETYLLQGGGDKIGGMGEVGPTGIPAAVANAIFVANGERLRTLPLSRHGYSFAQT